MGTELLNAVDPLLAVAQKVRRIARAQARLERLQAGLQGELDAVRRRYDRPIAAVRNRTDQLHADLEAHCRAERDAILPPGRKSLTTPFGEVGFRKAEAAIRLRDGLTEAEVCRMLQRVHLDELVRVRLSPDKPAVRKALAEERVGPDQLSRCGLVVVNGPERFHCRIRRDAVLEVGRG